MREVLTRARGRIWAPAPTDSAGHLHRTRWRLAALYTLTSAVGLFILGTVAITTDGNSHSERVDAEIRRRATMSQALSQFTESEPHELDASRIDDDAISKACFAIDDCHQPSDVYSFAFYQHNDEADPTDQLGVFDLRTRLAAPLPDIDVSALVASAYINESDAGEFRAYTAPDGRELRAVGVAIYSKYKDNGARAGTVIVVADPNNVTIIGRNLAGAVWGGCAALIALSGIGGWLLAGRSLRPAAESLDQQERFIADAAHELRMPITRVRAVAESAQLGARLVSTEFDRIAVDAVTIENMDELQRDLARTIALADQAGGTVDNLLTLARMDADRVELTMSPTRLDQLGLVVVDAYPEAELIHLDRAVVKGDAVLLRRAIENLIENALHHGRQDHDRVKPPELSIRVHDDHARIVVADHGPGIAPDLSESLFRRFRSGAGSRGSGLGLSIVQWIVTAHGGSISATNRPAGEGLGAVFTIDLPRLVPFDDFGEPPKANRRAVRTSQLTPAVAAGDPVV